MKNIGGEIREICVNIKVKQRGNKGNYKNYVDKLIDQGKAYYAFDDVEELNLLRKAHEKKGETFIYNWENRKNLKNSMVFASTLKETPNKMYLWYLKTPNKMYPLVLQNHE